MKILLVYANPYTHLWPAPAGLSMVARAAREAGHDVAMADLMFEEDPDGLLRRALDAKPDIVGMTLRNIDNADTKSPRSFVADYVRWVGMAREVAPTIIGGPAVTAAPVPLFQRTGADWAMTGQGETSFPVFLEEFSSRATTFTASGLMWRDGDAVRSNPPDFSGHKRGLDWSVIDRAKYKRPFMSRGLLTKSGCAHRCAFCDAPATAGSHFLLREPAEIVEDIRRDAADYKLNKQEYMMIDPCFNQPLGWAKSLLEAIIRCGVKVRFSAIVEPTGDIDREFCQLLVKAGCTMVTGLVGSYDDDVLSQGARPFNAADIAHAYELFESTHVLYMPQLMFGGPGETQRTVENTLRFAQRTSPLMVQGGWGVRVYPLAPMRQRAIDDGQVSATDDLLDPAFYVAPGLDRDWLDAKVRTLGTRKLASLGNWCRFSWRHAQLSW
jgi:radical SAM superfamily enzyme YgiQ (UPF0313 family)